MTPRERLRELYAPIRDHVEDFERAWIDDVLATGNLAEIVDATRWCRERIDGIHEVKMEAEA